MLKWWRRRFEEKTSRAREIEDQYLPFTSSEMARLIRRGRREDFQKLAAGLSKPHLAPYRGIKG
jgi:hypothetical protein